MGIYGWLQATFGLTGGEIKKVITTLITVLAAWLFRFLVLRLVYAQSEDVRTRYQWRKAVTYIVVPLTLVALFRIWLGGGGSMLTYLGLVSAGVAIALKDPLVNLAGWGFILWRRPFAVGDRIEINGMRGDVIDVRIFNFSLVEIGNWVDADQSTGRIVHVPNGFVFTTILANYNQGLQFIWHEIPVVLTFESDWKKAHEILTRIVNSQAMSLTDEAQRRVREAAERYMIFFTNLTPIVYLKVLDSGVALTLRFLCDPRRRRGTEDKIWREILEAFAQHDDIDFAYPTVRYYDMAREGPGGSDGAG